MKRTTFNLFWLILLAGWTVGTFGQERPGNARPGGNSANQTILYVSAAGNDSTAVRGDITRPWGRLFDFDGTNRFGVCNVATNGDTIMVMGTNFSAYVPLNEGVTLAGLSTNSAVIYTNRMLFTNDLAAWKAANGNYAAGPDHPMIALSARCTVRDLFIDARDGAFVPNTPITAITSYITPFASGVGNNNAPFVWKLDNTNFVPNPYAEYSLLGFTNRPGPKMRVENCRVWANVDVVYFNWYGFCEVYYSSTNDPAYDGGYTGIDWGATESAMTWTTNLFREPVVELTIDRSTRFDSYWDYMVVSGGGLYVTFLGEAHAHSYGSGVGTAKGPSVQIYNDGMYYDAATHYLAAVTNQSAGNCSSIVGVGPVVLQGTTFYNSNSIATAAPFQYPSAVTGFYYDAINSVGRTIGAGLVSTASQSPVAIATTGWTNTFGVNANVIYGGTTVSSWKKKSGALTSTNITYPVFTGNNTVNLKPGDAIVISGTGVSGMADPL